MLSAFGKHLCPKYDFAHFCFWPMNFSFKTTETAVALQQLKRTQLKQLNNQNLQQKPSLPILNNNIIISGAGRPSFLFNANQCEWRVLNPILTFHPYFSLLWKPIHCNVSLSLQRILSKLLKMLLMSMNVPHELVTQEIPAWLVAQSPIPFSIWSPQHLGDAIATLNEQMRT